MKSSPPRRRPRNPPRPDPAQVSQEGAAKLAALFSIGFFLLITCLQNTTCAMRPLSFFRLAERKIAPRPVEERKGAKRGQRCAKCEIVRADIEPCASLVQGPCRIATPSAVLPGSQTASRGCMRGEGSVRRTIERQRNAGAPPTPHCSSGDPGSSLGLPSFVWSPEDTSSGCLSLEIRRKPLPVADAGAAPDPQPRLWRAVAKQARQRHCGKA